MAGRSTRNKLRFQVKKAIADIERAQKHLKYLDELQEGRHPRVEERLPKLIMAMEYLITALERFREEI